MEVRDDKIQQQHHNLTPSFYKKNTPSCNYITNKFSSFMWKVDDDIQIRLDRKVIQWFNRNAGEQEAMHCCYIPLMKPVCFSFSQVSLPPSALILRFVFNSTYMENSTLISQIILQWFIYYRKQNSTRVWCLCSKCKYDTPRNCWVRSKYPLENTGGCWGCSRG